ncbi:DHH family phosphoesterase [Natronorarus salvus]|uniref:DHH family phosphoesterase n=1 Tax=Natronorarus salvus TaxID=3117733 RepID=UPI002F26608E
MTWLLLGVDDVGRVIGTQSDEHVHIVIEDPDEVDAFGSAKDVSVTTGDPTDPAVLARVEEPIGIATGTRDGERTLATIEAARETFPGVPVVVYATGVLDEATRERLSERADRVIGHCEAVWEYVFDIVACEPALRAHELRRTLLGIEGSLGVVMHDNPDPDAIASGIALAALARSYGIEAEACYYGEITHQENRALVNLLDLDLRSLGPDSTGSEFDAIALVDHSTPGINDQLPEETPVEIVIDHHPTHGPVDARHFDIRSWIGSASSILVEYFIQLGVEPDEVLATALLFGIQTDTDGFTRGVSELDFDAAAVLVSLADRGILDRLEQPTMTRETVETFARAIRDLTVRDGVGVSCVGSLRDRDSLAQSADLLLNREDVSVTLVFGIERETVYLSARARGTEVDVGEVLREAFDQIGSAGGHAQMAGGQLPVGILGDGAGEDERLIELVREAIAERFFETVEDHRGRVSRRWPTAGEQRAPRSGERF